LSARGLGYPGRGRRLRERGRVSPWRRRGQRGLGTRAPERLPCCHPPLLSSACCLLSLAQPPLSAHARSEHRRGCVSSCFRPEERGTRPHLPSVLFRPTPPLTLRHARKARAPTHTRARTQNRQHPGTLRTPVRPSLVCVHCCSAPVPLFWLGGLSVASARHLLYERPSRVCRRL
jgi:hypothetical protein